MISWQLFPMKDWNKKMAIEKFSTANYVMWNVLFLML